MAEAQCQNGGRWSDVVVEAPDDELNASCDGVEFSQVEVFPGAVEEDARGRLLLYLEFRVHRNLWRDREDPIDGEFDGEGWLDGAFLISNRFGSHSYRPRVEPADIGRSGVHRVGADEDQSMLVLVRQVPQEREQRWVMSQRELLSVGLMERKLFGGILSDVLEDRRAGKPSGFIADRELDLSRLLVGWFSGLCFAGELPGDLLEGTAESMNALAECDGQIDRGKFLDQQARDVAALLRVVVNDDALLFGVIENALDLLEIRQTFATSLDLVASVG